MSIRTPSPRRMTRQGTRTLKAAYAQAARDVKKMDPAVLAAVGRAKLNGNDLKYLAHANVSALYGNTNDQRFAQQLNAQAAAHIQATTPAAQHTRNPFKKLANWNQNRKDIRAGRQALEAAYGQAKSEVKRIDPNVRQAIGHSRVTKQDLKMLSHAQLSGALRAGIEQAAQHHYAQARASAAAVAAQPQVVRQSAGQRAANAVNTVSRWADGAKAKLDGAMAKAEKFRSDYSERRQNPTGRSARPAAEAGAPGREAPAPTVELPVAGPEAGPAAATVAEAGPEVAAFSDGPPTIELPVITPETTPAAAQAAPDLAASKAAEAKNFHAGLNNTMPMPTPEAGPVFNGPVSDVQLATGNTGSVTQNKVVTSGKGGPPTPGADPAMASASGAVATKPTTQQATSGPQTDTSSHNKHRKPDGHER